MEKIKIKHFIDEDKRDELKEKLFNEFKSNEKFYNELSNFGMFDSEIYDNIGLLTILYEERLACSKCKSLNECSLDNKYFNATLVKTSYGYDYEYGYCKYYLEKKKRECFLKGLGQNENIIPFNKLDISSNRKELFKHLLFVLKGKKEMGSIYIKKTSKCGASSIIKSFLNKYVMEQNDVCIYTSAPEIFSRLSSIIFLDKINYSNEFNELKNANLLVLDDFDLVSFTDFNRENIIFNLIAERSSKNLSTIIISSIKKEQLALFFKAKYNDIRSKQFLEMLDSNYESFDISTNLNLY